MASLSKLIPREKGVWVKALPWLKRSLFRIQGHIRTFRLQPGPGKRPSQSPFSSLLPPSTVVSWARDSKVTTCFFHAISSNLALL